MGQCRRERTLNKAKGAPRCRKYASICAQNSNRRQAQKHTTRPREWTSTREKEAERGERGGMAGRGPRYTASTVEGGGAGVAACRKAGRQARPESPRQTSFAAGSTRVISSQPQPHVRWHSMPRFFLVERRQRVRVRVRWAPPATQAQERASCATPLRGRQAAALGSGTRRCYCCALHGAIRWRYYYQHRHHRRRHCSSRPHPRGVGRPAATGGGQQ